MKPIARLMSNMVLNFAMISCAFAQPPIIRGIANAASGGSAVVPQMLVSIYGSNLAVQTATANALPLTTQLGGTAVAFNGIAAPLLYVSSEQINAQVPSGVRGSASANVVVTTAVGKSSAFSMPVNSGSAPRIFTQRSPARPEHPVYWGFALFVMLAATTASLCGEFRRWPLITEKPYVDFVRVFALAGPLLFMTCMVFRPFVNPPDKPVHSAEGVQSWGRLTSVLIVLLAIFAFGIEVKDVPIVDTGNKAGIQIVDKGNKAGIQSTPSVRWAELPAILIVFLLAEMGLELVVLSIDSREAMLIANKSMDETKLATASAAARATEAVGHLKDATGAFGGAKTDALKAIDELHSWTKTYAQISEELIKGGKQFPTLLGFVDKESEKKYWERLFLFARSWIPDPHPSQETGRLIGELFITFMGSSVGTGSVRRSANSISCITADAVFAEASKRWLEQMAQKPDGQLVVWALTTLLPTEFAFPSAYRGSGDLSASRIKSLNHFTDAVMRSCLKKEVADYRRITVFEKSKATVL